MELQQTPQLTKSLYADGVRCKKLLWNKIHRSEQIPPPDEDTLVRFAEGNEVTKVARSRFPDGILVSQADKEVVIRYTQELLELGKPLFEAGFQYDGSYVRCDILLPSLDGWDLIEVKSTTELKEEHLVDIGFQRYVLEGTGLKIRSCSIMYLNGDYVLQGPIDLQQLFIIQDVSAECNHVEIPLRLQDLRQTLDYLQEPVVPIGHYCKNPHTCALKDRCWSYLPEENVTQLYWIGKKAFPLLEQGTQRIIEINGQIPLNAKQQIQINAHRTKTIHIDKPAIKKFIQGLSYPLTFFDFETVSSAIPRFDGQKPHQHIPCQYSLHVLNENGTIEHFEYLADCTHDPRQELMETLKKHLPTQGSILVYYAAFEKSKLQDTAIAYAVYHDWVQEIVGRVVDLYDVFNNFWYYDPKQCGSCSIKKVLPALCGNGYEDMEIGDGGTATREYARITYTECSPEEKKRVRSLLLTYCKQDTQSMIDILHVLQKVIADDT